MKSVLGRKKLRLLGEQRAGKCQKEENSGRENTQKGPETRTIRGRAKEAMNEAQLGGERLCQES